jgi:hypothetical protein
MYDADRDGMLTHAEFDALIQDISSHVVQHQVEQSVKELHVFELGEDAPLEMISYDDFQMVRACRFRTPKAPLPETHRSRCDWDRLHPAPAQHAHAVYLSIVRTTHPPRGFWRAKMLAGAF